MFSIILSLYINNNDMEQIFFSSANVDSVMQTLIMAFEANLFPQGSPARPTALAKKGDSDLLETSTGQPLVSAAFSVPPLHIPNAGDGPNARHSFKSELVLVRDPAVGTKKIMWWYGDDPREIPHNHPWDFRSGIISGGYTEERSWITNGILKSERRKYVAGTINEVPADVFHNVFDVLPNTVTYLDCGPAREGNEWGYLDGEKYQTWKDLTPANFLECFKGLNTHSGKK